MFDVFGNTVNIAARLEATGVPQRVHMTKASSDLLTPMLPSTAMGPPRPTALRNREDSEVRELCTTRAPFNNNNGGGLSPDLIPIFQAPPPSLIQMYPIPPEAISTSSPSPAPIPPSHHHHTNNNEHTTAHHQNQNNHVGNATGTPRNAHHGGGGDDTFLEGCFFGTITFDMLSRRKTSNTNSPVAGTSPVLGGMSPARSPRSCFSISSASEWHFSEGVGGVHAGGGDSAYDGATWVVLKGVGSIQTVLIESYEPPVVWPSPEGEEWADLVAISRDRARLAMREACRLTSCASLLPPPPIRILGTTHDSASSPNHSPPIATLTTKRANNNVPPLDLQPITSSLGDLIHHFPAPIEEELEAVFKPHVINFDDGYDRG